MKNDIPKSNVRSSLLRIMAVTAAVLIVPIIGMQLSDDVNWGSEDFIFAGVLLFSSGLVYEFLIRKINSKKYRITAAIILLSIFALIWVEAAVGIFD